MNYFNILLMYISKKNTFIIDKQLIQSGSLILKTAKSKIDSSNWNLCIDLLNHGSANWVFSAACGRKAHIVRPDVSPVQLYYVRPDKMFYPYSCLILK